MSSPRDSMVKRAARAAISLHAALVLASEPGFVNWLFLPDGAAPLAPDGIFGRR